jgi:hypothetical protein
LIADHVLLAPAEIMERALPLDKMTLAEKLSAMENIWDDLLHNTENLPSPAWHRDVLQAHRMKIRMAHASPMQ